MRGCYTALITPFKGERLDEEGLDFLLEKQLRAGVAGIVALGTTSEEPTLTLAEKEKIVLAVKEKGLKLIVGTGTNSTQTTVERTKWAKDLGADAALVIAPYYNKPTQEGLLRHFSAIQDLPLIVYNHPGRTGINIDPAILSGLENVIAIKEASSDLKQVEKEIELGLTVLSGNDETLFSSMALGAVGVISVISNLIPEKWVSFVQAMENGEWERGRKFHYQMLPLLRALTLETNPIPIKTAMGYCGLPSGGFRLPLCEMAPFNRDKLIQKLGELCGHPSQEFYQVKDKLPL